MSGPGAWKTEVLRELEATSKTYPATTSDAWNLVWAIGHARALAPTEPEVAALLRTAEAHLEHHRLHVEQLLRGQLRVEPLLTGLESSLQAQHADEAQDRLLALEDVLVVAEALGFEPDLQRILAEVSRQVVHAPPTLAGFDELARERLQASGQAARALWNTVLAAASRVPVRSLPTALTSWLMRLDGVRTHLAHGATALLDRFDVSTAALSPVVTLGRYSPEFRVHVEGHCPPGWQLRLFLVDAEHPEGEPLREGDSEDYRRQAERWTFDTWRLNGSEDVALVIALAAPTLPGAASLAQLLQAAASIPDVRVTEVLLTPPSGQTP